MRVFLISLCVLGTLACAEARADGAQGVNVKRINAEAAQERAAFWRFMQRCR